MKLACLSFSDKGNELGAKIKRLSNINYEIHHFENSKISGGIKSIIKDIWDKYDALVFISATGIAIRLINEYIKSKTSDPAVVVVDDLGRFSISLLSGHLGGANEIAEFIAKSIDAIPVITTASDNRCIEAIDLFAMKSNYFMEDMQSITKLTSMMVNNKKIGFFTEEKAIIKYDNLEILDSLENLNQDIDGLIIVSYKTNIPDIEIPYTILRPKNINIGIGCRKGVEGARIIAAIDEAFNEANLSVNSINTIGTVDIKKDEIGIIEAAKYFNCLLKIFTRTELAEVQDKFNKSEFVKDTIGIYAVAEPSAYLLGKEIIKEKSKYNGITIAISK